MNSLQGKIIISTRPKGKSDSIQQAIEARGGTLLELPMIEIEKAVPSEEMITAIENRDDFDWIIFTSPNGIHNFFSHLKNITGDYDIAPRVRIAAIGEKTAEILNEYSIHADYINTGNTGKEFAMEMHAILNIGERVLLPTGNLAKDTFKEILEGKAEFTRIDVYNTNKPESFDKTVMDCIYKNRYDLIIFTSPSGVDNFIDFAKDRITPETLKVVSIGYTTTKAIESHGILPLKTAKMSTAEGIIKSIAEIYQ